MYIVYVYGRTHTVVETIGVGGQEELRKSGGRGGRRPEKGNFVSLENGTQI
jgi:hypothetical protein